MSAFVWGERGLFPGDTQMRSFEFMIAVILMLVSNIPFSMALSTFFTDFKVANYVGSLVLNFPIYIFLNIIQWSGFGRNFLYLLNWIPVVPVCSIMTRLTRPNEGLVPSSLTAIKSDWIIEPVEWLFLISNIPFWLVMYIYLDNVMPNTYGV